MESPFIDIHTHKTGSSTISLLSIRAGTDTFIDIVADAVAEIPMRMIADTPPDVSFYSAGIHPWDSDQAEVAWLTQIEHLHPAAIGEIGLDFGKPIDKTVQQEWFIRQLDLAERLNLPVVIHCVKAYNELIRIIGKYTSQMPGTTPLIPIVHGFTGSMQLAETLTNAGCYLSFGETLLRSPKTQEAFRSTPLERLFLETDESTLSIEEIYTVAANKRGCSVCELKTVIYSNFKNIFKHE